MTDVDAKASNISIKLRPSAERGHADHGWLKTYHSFSFADYYDPSFNAVGSLRVINEDRVAPGQGFPTHPHAHFEIWSYILDGELGHTDSMNNKESMKAGDLQLTYTGTGIRHSEYNQRDNEWVHFLQIWAVIPEEGKRRGAPKYYTRHFPRSQKLNQLCHILSPVSEGLASDKREADGPAPLESPISMYASILEEGKKVEHQFKRGKGYVHLAMKSGYREPGEKEKEGSRVVRVGGKELVEGDGAYLDGVEGETVLIEGVTGESEFVLFDLD